jgi:hypothetical protein
MIRHPLVDVSNQRFQHLAQGPGDSLDSRGLEQIGGVGEVTAQPARGVGEVERQIEAGVLRAAAKFLHAQPGQPCAGRLGLLGGIHMLVDFELEQRVMAQVAFRRQGVHQVLERQFLMGLGAGHHLFYLLQQLSEGLALIDLHTQHLSVDEKADQAFQFAAGAPGIGGTDANVALAAVARQHHRQRSQGQHENGLAVAARQGFQLRRQRFGQLDPHRRTAMAGLRRAWVVKRQLQHRLLAAQLLFPVVQLPLALPGFQPGPLPYRVVGVLNGQWRQLHASAADLGLIQLDELADQQLPGPTVRDHVMHAYRQHMFGLAELEQPDPQQLAAEQIERGLQLVAYLLLEVGRGNPGHLQGNRCLGENLLMKLAVDRHEAGTQGFVTLHKVIQRPGQGAMLQRAVQTHRQRHVVGDVARLQLPEKQHALLGVGQRDALQLVANPGNGQQTKALAGLAHFVEDLPPLLDGQADEAFGDTFSCRLVHVRSPPFHSSFFRYRTSRLRSATGHRPPVPG